MNNEQIKLVQDSFAKVRRYADEFATLFYGRLFEINPSLKAIFPDDMELQGRKFMTMIATAVDNLNRFDAIMPSVQALGRRHAKYDVKPEYYDTMAAAFLWTLEQKLGDGFTPDVKDAWTKAYTVLATTMKEAAAAQQAA